MYSVYVSSRITNSLFLFFLCLIKPVLSLAFFIFFFFSSRRRHTRYWRDWSSDVCSSDLVSGLHLVVHLARAGWLHWRTGLPTAPPKPGKGPLALRVHLEDGNGFDLTEQGTRKGLAVYVVRSPAEVPGISRLGPDALEVDRETFAALLKSRSGQLKGALTDQTLVAGIGNAYSDEILHAARLSPFKMADKLSDDELVRLFDAIRATLTHALDRQVGQKAATLKGEKRSGLMVHARSGLPCPVCGDTVREVKIGRAHV